MKRRWLLSSAATMLLPFSALAVADTCLDCHAMLEGALQAPATAYSKDVHAHRGFGCASCHGGDPTTSDMDASMSKDKGFLGKISRTTVPRLCARCHSDASLIHRFKPQQRVDQLAQYQTSVHGKRLATGDEAVATCTDCHSVHDIREVRDPLSPVHPLRLPETCARCHADPEHMRKYKLETRQFADYRTSVHWEALAKRGDLSAPSCASCHGNHGATPPQVSSVAAVCGTCHALMEDLYNKSPHQPVFGGSGQGGCVVCHSNHAIAKPSVAMLAGEKSVCAPCHDAGSAGGQAAVEMAGAITGLDQALTRSDQILGRARESGMEVSEAVLRQMEGRENLVKARVAVHRAQLAAVQNPVRDGLAIAAGTWRAGQDALKERERRRIGLAISLIAIVITMAGLWLAIRRLDAKAPAGQAPGGDV